jgi:hypothetical protein
VREGGRRVALAATEFGIRRFASGERVWTRGWRRERLKRTGLYCER